MLNQHKVHMNGIGPWTDHLDMSNPEGSACYGSRLAIEIDGRARVLTVSHYGDGFVGVFRPADHVELLYPEQALFAAIETRLPHGVDNDGEHIVVQEHDVLFCVLPHRREWQLKPVDLQGAMYGIDAADELAFDGWARNMIHMLRDSRATILLASIGSRRPAHFPQSFSVMYSQDYQASFRMVQSKRSCTSRVYTCADCAYAFRFASAGNAVAVHFQCARVLASPSALYNRWRG